jgi:hypothetical protein
MGVAEPAARAVRVVRPPRKLALSHQFYIYIYIGGHVSADVVLMLHLGGRCRIITPTTFR